MSPLRPSATAVVLLLLVSCSSDDRRADAPGACSVADQERSVGLAVQSPPEDLLQWAGFEDTTGLEVIESDEECGQDIRVRVALRGDAEAVASALDAAGFDDAPSEGTSNPQPPLDGADLDVLTGVVHSDQQPWENRAGERMFRSYARGMTEDNQEVLHIWAFTT